MFPFDDVIMTSKWLITREFGAYERGNIYINDVAIPITTLYGILATCSLSNRHRHRVLFVFFFENKNIKPGNCHDANFYVRMGMGSFWWLWQPPVVPATTDVKQPTMPPAGKVSWTSVFVAWDVKVWQLSLRTGPTELALWQLSEYHRRIFPSRKAHVPKMFRYDPATSPFRAPFSS